SMISGDIDGEADDHEIEPEDIPDPEPIPMSLTDVDLDDMDDDLPVGRPRLAQPQKSGMGPLKILGLSLGGLVVVVLATAYFAREAIIENLPMTEQYYVSMGLYHPEPGKGLAHQDVNPRRDVRNGVELLVVEGNVANVTEKDIAVPLLKVALTNNKGEEIRTEVVELSKPSLSPGEKIPFKVEFENPPGTARQLSLGFVERDQAKQGGENAGDQGGQNSAAGH
ncbi:MAG: DUF3426 domain-containing protein, partial [Alphaproteobacteria bacterium]|nr:DUF3426 domain-containing protein [Alphaproteobacteria bacterium]